MSRPMITLRRAKAGLLIAVSLALCCPDVSVRAASSCSGDFASFLNTQSVSQWSCASQDFASGVSSWKQTSTYRDLTFGMKEASRSRFIVTANHDPSIALSANLRFVLQRHNLMQNQQIWKEDRRIQQARASVQRPIEWEEFARFGWSPEDSLVVTSEKAARKPHYETRSVSTISKTATKNKESEEFLVRRVDAEFDVLSIDDLVPPASSGSRIIYDASENTSMDPLRLKNWDLNSGHTIRIGSLRR